MYKNIIRLLHVSTHLVSKHVKKSSPITALNMPWGFQEGWGSQISRQSAHEGGKVVSPTHRSLLPLRKYSWYSFLLGATRWGSWMRHCTTSRKVAGLITDNIIGIFPSGRTVAPGVDSASNRNEYQEYFLRGKGGRCVGLTTYHLHVPIVLKSWSLNLLKPSGPVQGCNGVALPLPLPLPLPIHFWKMICFEFTWILTHGLQILGEITLV
jgi:hypothetical protein